MSSAPQLRFIQEGIDARKFDMLFGGAIGDDLGRRRCGVRVAPTTKFYGRILMI